MPATDRVVKPRTRRGKRALSNREPKLIENTKQALFINGNKTSEVSRKCVKQLYNLRKPDAIFLNRKHDILPFEDVTPIEKLCHKYDTSLFVFSSHNKKRPNNIVIGRTFDGHVLDMFEFGYIPIDGVNFENNFSPRFGVKPCLIFNGEEFEQDELLSQFKNIVVDLFHHYEVQTAQLSSLEYVLSFTAAKDKIMLRAYRIILDTNNELKQPVVKLSLIEPSADLYLRRHSIASSDVYKRAFRRPRITGKKIQNVKRDAFGSKLGRVHMTSQSLNQLQTRKMKGLRNPEKKRKRKPSGNVAITGTDVNV